MSGLKNLKRVIAASGASRKTVVSAQSASTQINPINGLPVMTYQNFIITQQQTTVASTSNVVPKALRKAPGKK